jgi:DNA-binding transcriptional LysR family regulator
MDTNWDDYRFFLAIARERSLTAAGRVLNVSQPTVSRRLETLEAKLEVRLFNRTRHGYELTPVGQDLYESVQRIEEDFIEANRKIYGANQDLVGSLRITCTEILLTGYLAPFTWQFLQQNPGIELSVACTQSQLSLSRGDADLALRFTDYPPEALIGRKLATAAYCIYAASSPAGDQFRHGNRQEWDWIGVHDDMYNRMLFGDVMKERRFKHQADSMTAMQSMVRSGLGVTLLPCYVADQDPSLRRAEPDPVPNVSFDLWILYHPDVRRVSRIQLFSDFISESIHADLDLFEGRRPL